MEIGIFLSNDGGCKMSFNWYVKEKVGVLNVIVIDMEVFNLILIVFLLFLFYVVIGSDCIVRDVEYEIVVRVSNFLGESIEVILVVMWKVEVVLEVELSLIGVKILCFEMVIIFGKFFLFFYDLLYWVICNKYVCLVCCFCYFYII